MKSHQSDSYKPLLSIIIPVYNAEAFLEECLASVISQDFDDIEVICIDDGSTDRSLSLLEKWQSKDSRINIIQQPNSGPSAARNNGMKTAQGQYTTFVDADDLVRHNIYTTAIRKMEENELDVFFFAYETFPNGNVRTTHFLTETVMDYHQLFATNNHIQSKNALCFNWRFIFRTSVIKEYHLQFDEQIRYGEDMLFNIDTICHSRRIMVSDEPLYLYRKNPMGAMAQVFKPQLKNSLVKAYDIKLDQIYKYHIDEQGFYKDDIAEYYLKVFLPMLISNEFHRPNKKDLSSAIKEIYSLKMIRESFDRVGYRNIYPSIGSYVFYLLQKFKIFPVILYFYKKNYK